MSSQIPNKRLQTNEFVCDEYAFFRTINSVAEGYHPLTHVYAMIAIPAPGCGGTLGAAEPEDLAIVADKHSAMPGVNVAGAEPALLDTCLL